MSRNVFPLSTLPLTAWPGGDKIKDYDHPTVNRIHSLVDNKCR